MPRWPALGCSYYGWRFTFPWLGRSLSEVHEEVSLALRHTSGCASHVTCTVAVCLGPSWASLNRTAKWLESCLLLPGHRGRGSGALQDVSVQGAAAGLCLNSHLSYTGITAFSGTKVAAGILKFQQGGGAVMATTLCGWFSLLRIELGEQNCLGSSITEFGNINDRGWALLCITRFKVPIILIFLVLLALKQSKHDVCPEYHCLRGPDDH